LSFYPSSKTGFCGCLFAFAGLAAKELEGRWCVYASCFENK